VTALAERDKRLAQSRAGDAELRAQLAFSRQLRPRWKQPKTHRGSEAVDCLLEGGQRAYRREDGVERGRLLERHCCSERLLVNWHGCWRYRRHAL